MYSHWGNGEFYSKAVCSLPSSLTRVYAYFNNGIGGHAVRNALTLREPLQVGPHDE